MADTFKSKYTGEQIEEILDKANNVTDITPNNGEATTEDLLTLKIGDVNYKIPEQSDGSGETPTNRIKFTINGIPYEADEGMTWEEWVASEYSYGAYAYGSGWSNMVTTKYGYPEPDYGFVSALLIRNVATENYAAKSPASMTNYEYNIVSNGVYTAQSVEHGGGSND